MFPKVLPFHGIRYNPAKVGDIAAVVSPPYDVIYPEMQEALYKRHDVNFVRVDLAKGEGQERYKNAKHVFEQWVRLQILVTDDSPNFYFHHHTFTLADGSEVTRKGFFAARRIEDLSEGGIKPHERTLDGPKADRLQLTRAVHANLSPVFSLYADPKKEIDRLVARLIKDAPLISFKTAEGERHELWKEENPTVCKFISDVLQDKPLFIADGHHRFETALNYRNECRQTKPGTTGMEAHNYVLMYLSNMSDEGLIILPIHRALHHLPMVDLKGLLGKLESFFKVTKLASQSTSELTKMLAQNASDSHAFVLVTKNPADTYLLTIKRRAWRESPVALKVPRALMELDVSVLHRLIFEEILRLSPEAQARQENIIYWKDTAKAVAETQKGACELTFLLNPTRIEEMERVAMAGEKMPQKSTFFYPKVLSGLVVMPLSGNLG